jgi:hypothetical protein
MFLGVGALRKETQAVEVPWTPRSELHEWGVHAPEVGSRSIAASRFC